MSQAQPDLPERRAALLLAARHLTAEAGVAGGAILDPRLADDIAAGMAAEIAAEIDRRTAAPSNTEELVEGLLGAVLETSRRWRDALALANVAIERVGDFERWEQLLAPWLRAVERAIARGQKAGLVRADVDPGATALVLRDALDRTAKVAIRFERDDYREATAALVRAALRA